MWLIRDRCIRNSDEIQPISHSSWPRFLPNAAAAVDLGDQTMDVFWSDAVRDHGAWIIVLYIEVYAVFRTGPDEVLDEIQSTSWSHPAEIGIWILRFDDDIVMQEDVAVKGEVAKRTKPRRWIDQLISDDERHRGVD